MIEYQSKRNKIKGMIGLIIILFVAVLLKNHYQSHGEYLRIKDKVNYYHDNLNQYKDIKDCSKVESILKGLNSHLVIANNQLKNHKMFNIQDIKEFSHECL